ncbi:hypothetical protein M404DRAFT_541088 [Pisolithus tinctorius Marx 270]|uniref:Uncharacterized protein n=1 Tax=Pisolithus tinctorius Marx 270 TaxID=870435 RepID=A0A0C3PAY8_PISTI|nr:hypothetical protein M404DRAFT_541088 [Pisolithus tinctorius Marx 270]
MDIHYLSSILRKTWDERLADCLPYRRFQHWHKHRDKRGGIDGLRVANTLAQREVRRPY